jgi:hypothetical protein
MQSGTTTRLSVAQGAQGNGASTLPVIDDAGDIVSFQSTARNLVAGDTNGVADVFAVTVATGAVTLVSAALDGGPADAASSLPAISAGGDLIVWKSAADDLVVGDTDTRTDIFLRQLS